MDMLDRPVTLPRNRRGFYVVILGTWGGGGTHVDHRSKRSLAILHAETRGDRPSGLESAEIPCPDVVVHKFNGRTCGVDQYTVILGTPGCGPAVRTDMDSSSLPSVAPVTYYGGSAAARVWDPNELLFAPLVFTRHQATR